MKNFFKGVSGLIKRKEEEKKEEKEKTITENNTKKSETNVNSVNSNTNSINNDTNKPKYTLEEILEMRDKFSPLELMRFLLDVTIPFNNKVTLRFKNTEEAKKLLDNNPEYFEKAFSNNRNIVLYGCQDKPAGEKMLIDHICFRNPEVSKPTADNEYFRNGAKIIRLIEKNEDNFKNLNTSTDLLASLLFAASIVICDIVRKTKISSFLPVVENHYYSTIFESCHTLFKDISLNIFEDVFGVDEQISVFSKAPDTNIKSHDGLRAILRASIDNDFYDDFYKEVMDFINQNPELVDERPDVVHNQFAIIGEKVRKKKDEKGKGINNKQ